MPVCVLLMLHLCPAPPLWVPEGHHCFVSRCPCPVELVSMCWALLVWIVINMGCYNSTFPAPVFMMLSPHADFSSLLHPYQSWTVFLSKILLQHIIKPILYNFYFPPSTFGMKFDLLFDVFSFFLKIT